MQQPPIGAIENGREHMKRLLNHYDFQCEAGLLGNCTEFQQLQQCFEVMAEWIAEESDDWEPSETQQGLVPIPAGYAES